MEAEDLPSVEIVVNRDGVSLVRFRGESMGDEPETSRIYTEIRHLVNQIDRALKIANLSS
jgi:hypothetical protein